MTASLRQWEYVMGVNFFGVGHTLRHFVPKMMDQEAPGAIVTTASLTGIRVGAGLCAAPLCSPNASRASIFNNIAANKLFLWAPMPCIAH